MANDDDYYFLTFYPMLFLWHDTDYTVLIEELSNFYLYFDFIAFQNQTYCINVTSLHLQM